MRGAGRQGRSRLRPEAQIGTGQTVGQLGSWTVAGSPDRVIATRPGFARPMTLDSLGTLSNCHIARTVSDVMLLIARSAAQEEVLGMMEI